MSLYYVCHMEPSDRDRCKKLFPDGKTQVVRCNAMQSPIGGDAIVQEMEGRIPFDWIVRQYNGQITKSTEKQVYFTAE